MNGPQHLAAANTALENAHSFTGPRDDIDRFNRYMRLFEAHLAMAQFELSANAEAWIAAITKDGQR